MNLNFIDWIIYFGIFVFAVTGALKARTNKMDIFGAFVLSFVTAYGGGSIRDILIGSFPVNWINDYVPFIIVLSATIVSFFFKLKFRLFRRIIFFTDAFGIGLYTMWGIEKSLAYGINQLSSLILGVITATFGGLLTDILCNEVPSLMKKGELYATACVIGGVCFLGLRELHLHNSTNIIVSILIIAMIRIYSVRKRIRLPEM